MKKKVLIIAYYWPPAGGPGVQRWLKFVKYLPQFDIEPIVYVPDNPSYPIIDETLISEVPSGITIIRQSIREPYNVASTLSRKQTKNISSGIIPRQKRQSFLQKAMIFIRGNFFIPDARIGWVSPSVKYLKKYIEENNIKTIITTGPPHSLHLVGLRLKDHYHDLQWITDFRDPWTTIGYHDKMRMSAPAKAKHKRLESIVLNTANHIIVTSPGTKKEFQAITKKPITVITNGFDDRKPAVGEPSDDFVIAHIGSLLSDRNPMVLWEVLKSLTQSNQDFARRFTLKLVGKVSEEVLTSIKNAGLEEYLDFVGYVPHAEAQSVQQQASVLLLVEVNSEITKGIIAGKIFEYLAAGRPILAIGPEGADIQDIIKETNRGYYHTYGDKNILRESILNLFITYKDEKWGTSTPKVNQYHRKNLTERLAALVNSLD